MPLVDPIPSPVVYVDFAALEWQPLLDLVAGFAASPVGREAALALAPSTASPGSHANTSSPPKCACCSRNKSPSRLAASSIHTIGRQIANRRRGPRNRRAAIHRRLAHDIAAWQALIQEPPARRAGKLPGLSELTASLAQDASHNSSSLQQLADAIERKIQPDGSLADDACPNSNTSAANRSASSASSKKASAPLCANSLAKASRKTSSSPSAASSDSLRTVTVQNIGNRTLAILDFSYPTDLLEAAGAEKDCISSMALGPGISCTLTIDFSPWD